MQHPIIAIIIGLEMDLNIWTIVGVMRGFFYWLIRDMQFSFLTLVINFCDVISCSSGNTHFGTEKKQ